MRNSGLGLGGLVLALGDVDGDHAARHADLDGGKADAGGLVHGLQHRIEEAAHVVVDALDGGLLFSGACGPEG